MIDLEKTNEEILGKIWKLFLKKPVVSIYGASGTGKSSLVYFLVGNYLGISLSGQTVWIQASKNYSKKRITEMFQKDSKKLAYLFDNVFIIPSRPCQSFMEQKDLLERIANGSISLPPFTKFIIIDNISHHLRYEVLSNNNNIKRVTHILDSFFELQLMPLIMYCSQNNINLILTHEITYVPSLDMEKPFFYKLYDRIDSLYIILKDNFYSKKKIITIPLIDLKLEYTLTDYGFKFKLY